MKVITSTPRNDSEWEQFVRGLVKVHLTMADLTYADLTDRLRAIGRPETEPNVRNRINNGRFSAIFLLQCLRAMEVEELTLPVDKLHTATKPRTAEKKKTDSATRVSPTKR
ncbi:DUF6471 domain-containing protein [Sphingomonas sp. LB2R24]|uniref:DUF6471 domain-containing protein n=1 Tax=Sphingomonas sorbitolis TaxID=3096165 RepID=UPI002FCBAD3B